MIKGSSQKKRMILLNVMYHYKKVLKNILIRMKLKLIYQNIKLSLLMGHLRQIVDLVIYLLETQMKFIVKHIYHLK